MIERLLSPRLVKAIGWILVHTLWQAAVFALLLGGLLVWLRKFSSQARYVVSVGILGAFFMTVGLTFAGQYTSEEGIDALAPASAPDVITVENLGAPTGAGEMTEHAVIPTESPGFSQWLSTYYATHLPLIVTLWLLGVLVLQLRWLRQLALIQRLKSYGVRAIPTRWATQIMELENALGIRKRVNYLISRRVSSPLTVGWLALAGNLLATASGEFGSMPSSIASKRAPRRGSGGSGEVSAKK